MGTLFNCGRLEATRALFFLFFAALFRTSADPDRGRNTARRLEQYTRGELRRDRQRVFARFQFGRNQKGRLVGRNQIYFSYRDEISFFFSITLRNSFNSSISFSRIFPSRLGGQFKIRILSFLVHCRYNFSNSSIDW